MTKTLNLIYAKQDSSFFNKLDEIKGIILDFKEKNNLRSFDARDEHEVGRADSYAVFPELKALVNHNEKVTLATLRDSLAQRKVKDGAFQDKIISFILQTKLGLQFPLGSMLQALLLEDTETLYTPVSRTITMRVQDKKQVMFTMQDTLQQEGQHALHYKLQLQITPERIMIHAFELTRANQSKVAQVAFTCLQKNQASILQKLIMFIKSLYKSRGIELERKPTPVKEVNAQKALATVIASDAAEHAVDDLSDVSSTVEETPSTVGYYPRTDNESFSSEDIDEGPIPPEMMMCYSA